MITIRESVALTFDDVLLVPRASEVLPQEVSVASKLTSTIPLRIPLLSAAMDTVTESSLAIAIAQEGGMGVIHKNMSAKEQADEVVRVKKFESGMIQEPVCVSPDLSLSELNQLRQFHGFSGFPVVDNGLVKGIITNRDVRFESNQQKPVEAMMTPRDQLVTVTETADKESLLALFHEHRVEKILVLDAMGHLKGMVTVKDILKAEEKPHACKDSLGRLRVAAAVGTGEKELQRAHELVSAGVDAIVVDTAHGHHCSVIEQVKQVRSHYPDLAIIAGNIATGTAALALIEAGADAVKVGMGPGSICTTRVVAGIGMPQISAIMDVRQAVGDDFPIIADGGIRYSGDVAKALAAGANSVMIGGMFAGTDESPGEIELYQGRSYKAYRGMGSMGAMLQKNGSRDRYLQSKDNEKLVPEGIEGRVSYKGPMRAICDLITGGVRSSMGYLGCTDIASLHQHAEMVRITNAGVREGHAHDVVITKEAPNYQQEK